MMTRAADQLADATGLGEAPMGAIFLGASTSLSGTITSITAAYQGCAELAVGIALVGKTGISETFVGTFIASVTTSLPELITSVAAVRQGALTLAVGVIIGGNCFDVLFLSLSDMAYRQGSIYASLTQEQPFIVAFCIFLTAILLLGLVRREKHGIADIGFESFLNIVFYVVTFIVVSVY